MRHAVMVIAGIYTFSPSSKGADNNPRVDLPLTPPVALKPYAQLAAPANIEPSGLVKSRIWEGTYWSHNDSGDEPRIFAVHKNGNIVESRRYENREGVRIPDAVNVDWEDIATDDAGNLIIGDFGNSVVNDRRDLAVYFIIEPHPTQGKTSVKSKTFFSYPDQERFPAIQRNFDCEAMFWAHGKVYLLTKHRSDRFTKLYRMDAMAPGEVNPLTLLGTFDIRGRVTAADATRDGRRLAVLTYNAVWLFEATGEPDAYFEGRVSWLPIDIGQCEAICLDGANVILSSNEGSGDLYELPLDRLMLVKP